MTTTQPAALPELPGAFGYLCDWGNDSFGLTRQTVYYDEPGSATLDDWNEYPKVHENQPIYTADQMRARDAMWAERLAALQPKLAHQGDQQCTNGTPNTSQQPHAAEQQNDTRTQSDGSAAQSVPGLFTRVDDFRNPAAVSDAEIRSVWLATADQIPHCEHYLHFARAILALRPQVVPMTWPKARDVGRFGDMHPMEHLRVGLDSDNDVYVSVWGEKGGASVEFCNPGGGGGGSSRRTREALIALMVAMEADNADRPDKDWWARRNGITAQGAQGEQA